MIKWSLLRDRLLRVLDDVDRDAATYNDDDLRDYINEALVAIAPHTAQEKVMSLTLATSVSAIALPDDVLELGPVLSTYGTTERHLYRPYKLRSGESLPIVTAASVGSSLGYYVWAGSLNTLSPIPAGRTLTVHYYAEWDRVDEETDTLHIKRWMEEAVKWYALHSAMAKPARNAANLRQYNTAQDSGTPEHNPLMKFAKFCLERYETLLIEHPSQVRTGWEGK